MVTITRPKTYLDLDALPDDGNRYEVIYGELHVAAAPSWEHQDVLAAIMDVIRPHVRARRLGKVLMAPVDVRPLGKDQVQPDLIFIRRERLHLLQGGVFHGAPDLVVEVLSPTTRRFDEGLRLQFYAEAGVPEYWIADPETRTLRVLVLRVGLYEPAEADAAGRLRSSVLPDLIVASAEMFAVLDEFPDESISG
jgi:Uma2 family endonuclease